MYSAIDPSKVSIMMYDGVGTYASGSYVPLYSVTQCNFGYDLPKSDVNILGHRTESSILSGPPSTSFSMSRLWGQGKDILLAHTGRSDLKFHLGKIAAAGTRLNSYTGISLTDGAISNLSISVSAGEVPSISADFIFSDNNFYDLTGAQNGTGAEVLTVIPQTGIQLNIGSQAGNNVVISTNFSMKFNWIKEPRVNDPSSGQRFLMELTRPINYTANIELTMDDYMIDRFSFSNPKTWELKIYESSLLATYTMKNPELVGESVNFNSQGIQTVSLQYRGVG